VKTCFRPFVSGLVILSLLVAHVPPAFADGETEARYRAEAERIVLAYNTFTDEELATIRGSGFFRRIMDHVFSYLEAVPVLGERVRDIRETDPTQFSEEELARYTNTSSNQKNVELMMNQLFRETVGFIARMSAEEEVSVETRTEILKKVISATGFGFGRMTEPFEDPLPPAREFGDVWSEYQNAGYFKWFGFVHFGAQWALAQAQWIGREVTSLVTGQAVPIPFVEFSAERRSHSTEQLAREIRIQVRKDAARLMELNQQRGFSPRKLMLAATSFLQARLGNPDKRSKEHVLMSLVAMEEVIKATEDSEPLQHGTRNRVVRRFYMALAMVFLVYGGPEIGPFLGWSMGFAERTLVGSIAAMVQWVGASLWLARSRRQNSGLQYHKEVYGGATPILGKRGLYDEIRSLTTTPDGRDFTRQCHVLMATAGPNIVGSETEAEPPKRRPTRRRS
jgi:hypothetical protein